MIESFRRNYGGLNSSVYVLFVARIINRMGGFVHSFLALYLSTKLGYGEERIATYILYVGFVSAFAPFIGGKLADARGRKVIYLVVQTIAALLFIPCGIFTYTRPETVPILLIMASAMSSMIEPVNSAMVADLTKTPEERKRALALLYLGINVGVAIGPMIAGFLLHKYIFWFFVGDAITTMISVVLVGLFVKETQLSHEEMKAMEGGEAMESGHALLVFFRKPMLVFFTIFAPLNSIVYAQGGFALPLYVAKIFGEEKGGANFGILLSFNAVVVLIFTIAVTEVLKKNRPITNIMLASLLYVVGFGSYAFISTPFLLLFIPTFIWTIGEIVSVTNFNVFVYSHTPVNYRGRFSAIISFVTGAGYIASPKLMSKYIVTYGYQSAWLFVGVIALVAAMGFCGIRYFDRDGLSIGVGDEE